MIERWQIADDLNTAAEQAKTASAESQKVIDAKAPSVLSDIDNFGPIGQG